MNKRNESSEISRKGKTQSEREREKERETDEWWQNEQANNTIKIQSNKKFKKPNNNCNNENVSCSFLRRNEQTPES